MKPILGGWVRESDDVELLRNYESKLHHEKCKREGTLKKKDKESISERISFTFIKSIRAYPILAYNFLCLSSLPFDNYVV